ncbi:MAG: DUF4293 domain-containing protein [Bacteroidia bacterium]|nr:DUF4293 domain-containing protein [Bacteroidia bacterium]
MIQRIQSILLLLAILINFATFFVPMWQHSAGLDTEIVTGLSISSEDPISDEKRQELFFQHKEPLKSLTHIAFFSLVLISGVFVGYVIFRYDDRIKQIRLAYIGIGLVMLEILSFVLLSNQKPTLILGGTANSVAHFGFAFPVAAIVLIWLAINRIKKDEELVRSVDRIR